MSLAAVIALLAFAGPQRAQAATITINFDDISTHPNGEGAVPEGYQSLDWDLGPAATNSDWIIVSDTRYQGVFGNEYGAPSPDNAASNGSADIVMTVSDGADFSFLGAKFTGWADSNLDSGFSATTVTIQGLNNGSPVGDPIVVFLPTSFDDDAQAWRYDDYVTLDLTETPLNGIDALQFTTSANKRWLMDDLMLSGPTLVPEPGTVLLMGSGLLGLAYQGRKRRA